MADGHDNRKDVQGWRNTFGPKILYLCNLVVVYSAWRLSRRPDRLAQRDTRGFWESEQSRRFELFGLANTHVALMWRPLTEPTNRGVAETVQTRRQEDRKVPPNIPVDPVS